MKYPALAYLILAACCAVVLSDDHEKMLQIGADCRKENGVSEEEFQQLRSGNIAAADVKDNMKCMTQCFFTKTGLMDDTGKFDADALKAKLAEHGKQNLQEAVEKCKNMKGDNPCDTAFKIMSCMHEQKMEIGH